MWPRGAPVLGDEWLYKTLRYEGLGRELVAAEAAAAAAEGEKSDWESFSDQGTPAGSAEISPNVG